MSSISFSNIGQISNINSSQFNSMIKEGGFELNGVKYKISWSSSEKDSVNISRDRSNESSISKFFSAIGDLFKNLFNTETSNYRLSSEIEYSNGFNEVKEAWNSVSEYKITKDSTNDEVKKTFKKL